MVIVTVYALVDAARYNRRKKQEYFTEKRAAYAAGLIVSRRAIEAGTANQAQKDLVAFDDEETARLERLQAEKLAAKGSWGRGIKDFLFGGLKEEEDRRALTSLVQELVHEVTPEEEKKEGSEEESPSFMASKVDEIGERAKASMTHEKSNQERGGPLDHLGAQATQHPDTKSTQSWTSWLTRR